MSKHRWVSAALVGVVLLVAQTPARAQSTREGTIGRTGYSFHWPDGWNGKLVIWLPDVATKRIETIAVFGPANLAAAGPLGEHLVAQGYAVATTTYQDEAGRTRPGGYGAFTARDNLERLVGTFKEEVGIPTEVLLYGEGVGGLIAVQAIEQGIGASVTGALAMCAPLAGSRKWDAMLDLRLGYDAVCRDSGPKAQIPGGATGLPEQDDDFPAQSLGSAFLMPQLVRSLGQAVNACTGVDQAPKLRSRQQRKALKQLVKLTTRPEQALQRNIWWATAVLSNMTFDPNQLDGRIAVGNRKVDYPDAAIDAAIERVKPNKKASKKLKKFYTPSGKVGDARILALHTDRDGESVVEHLSTYASKVPGSSFTPLVVVEPTPSHCGFTPAERLAAWEGLLGWLSSGSQPRAVDVQAACEVHASGRTAAGPCRIDPDYKIGNLDDRILER